jgi:heterodisulfide reductase subunit B
MTQVSPEVAYELIRRLIGAADQYEADMMVTLCPMCQLNLDAYQGDTNRHFKTDYHMPVLYFTQLMGLAFGYGANELGIGKEFVDASEALAKIGVEVPVDEEQLKKQTRRRKKQEGLPMPRMPEEDIR